MTNVSTRENDTSGSAWNSAETVLTAQAVQQRGLIRTRRIVLPDDARGCEAQVLRQDDVTYADGTVRNIAFVATMANLVLTYDAITLEQLGSRKLARSIKGSRAIDAYLINDNWGIVGTPVIDPASQIAYVCLWTSPDGMPANGRHMLFALRLSDLSDAHPPLDLEGALYAPGPGLSPIKFASAQRKQRPGLALIGNGTEKAVLIGFGSLTESAEDSRGWVLAVSLTPWAVAAAWASTYHGNGGGIWQAGSGLASIGNKAYFITGNGAFAPPLDLGESLVELTYTPATAVSSASLVATDWWTGWTDAARVATGKAQAEEPDEAPQPANVRGVARAAAHAYQAMQMEGMDMGNMDETNPDMHLRMNMSAWGDMDLGSAGPLLLPQLGLMLGAGKDGIVYAAKIGAMGKSQPADLTATNAKANYAKLGFPPAFFTYYPGPDLDPAPADIRTLNLLYANRTHHMHGSPAHLKSKTYGDMVFNMGENGNLRAWSVTSTSLTYLACSAEVASANSPIPPGGMPGGMISVASNGTSDGTGIVVVNVPWTDANMGLSAGRLIVYAADTFDTLPNGSKQMRKLWDSSDWGIAFGHNKFNRATISDGRIWNPTYDGTIDVYDLTQAAA